MINKSFIDNIRKGLGRAYLELESAKNKEEYRESILYVCFNDCSYDFVTEGSKGIYLFDLINLFDDTAYFKQSIIDFLRNKLPKRNLFAQLLDILKCYYYQGALEIKLFLNDYYKYFIENGKWTKNKKMCYEYLCIIMYQIFGFKKVLNILKDIEKLNINKDDIGWFLFLISFKYKNNTTILRFLPKVEEDNTPKTYNHTFEEFLQLAREKRFNCSFAHWASDIEYEKCINYLKQTKNEEDIILILDAFQYEDCPKIIPEELLFSLLNVHSKNVDNEIYRTLSYRKSKKVENLALTLLNNKENAVSAMHMLMNNYKKDYKKLLVNAYKKIKFSFYKYTPLVSYTIDFMYSTKKDLPDEILFYAYEKSYDAFDREYIVDCMKKRKLLTEEILNELKHDSNSEIRKKAEKITSEKINRRYNSQ